MFELVINDEIVINICTKVLKGILTFGFGAIKSSDRNVDWKCEQNTCVL